MGDIYLVIEDEKVLKKMIYFLVYTLETLDGNRGSATQLIHEHIKKQLLNDDDEDN